MMYLSLDKILDVGRKVDPIIIRTLSANTPSTFLPSIRYPFQAGGKRMRAALVILCCAAGGGRMKDALRPAAAVEMIHNYSLVMDDLIDRGVLRRGKPTTRVVFGDSTSLLVAMYYREALDEIIQKSIPSSRIREVAVMAMKDIIDGERLDLLFEQAGREEPYLNRNRLRNPNFQQYLRMIGKKTAALFRAASEVGGLAAGADNGIVEKLREFGWKSGLAFQIMDDVLDIVGDETGKQRGKDIVEHKLGNAAILMAIRYLSQTKRRELLNILRSENASHAMVTKAIRIVAKTPAEAACREVAGAYLEDAKRKLLGLKASSYRLSLLSLCDLIVARKF